MTHKQNKNKNKKNDQLTRPGTTANNKSQQQGTRTITGIRTKSNNKNKEQEHELNQITKNDEPEQEQ